MKMKTSFFLPFNKKENNESERERERECFVKNQMERNEIDILVSKILIQNIQIQIPCITVN